MRKMLENGLSWAANRVISSKQPKVIAVTGSVGKSSAKEAIFSALSGRFNIKASPKNHNTEIGLPLTVLDLPEGGSSSVRWLPILLRALWRGSFGMSKFPDVLVLEMGLQHPGDIGRLCDIAPPNVGVVTSVGESHVEYMGSVEAIAREKGVIIERLPKEGYAILNRDDERVWAMRTRTNAEVISFGYHEEADIHALADSVSYVCGADRECGTHVKIAVKGSAVPFFIPEALGRHGVYAALAAAAVAHVKGVNLVGVSESMRNYRPPAGRMRRVEGIKRTTVVDDTYNASPDSTVAALNVLAELPLEEGSKRIAVLGDMLELGSETESAHEKVGALVAVTADLAIFVGERMATAKASALSSGMSADSVFHFPNADAARMFVQERMKKGDNILVKGSRGMKMEIVVKEIMAEPRRAKELLVTNPE